MRNPVWALIAGAVFSHYCRAQEAKLAHPIPFDWPSNERQALQVAKNLTPKSLVDDVFDNAEHVDLPSEVGTFTFAQLEKGKMYLVASLDSSGRDLFFFTGIAYCTSPQTCDIDQTLDAPPHNYESDLLDLDGDGIKEIVAKSLAGEYEGGASVSIFTYRIYRVKNGKLVDVSQDYKSYYQSVLIPRTKGQIKAFIDKTEDKSERERLQALETIVEDEYARRFLKQSTAGVEHAKAWAQSGNPRLEEYALNTLREIEDPAADAVLTELSKGDNERMAKAAAREIDARASARRDRQLRETMQTQKPRAN